MRCHAILWGLVLVCAAGFGCKQQCFLSECDYDHYRSLMPHHLDECTTTPCIQPEHVEVPLPATVVDPERKIRYISLAEVMAIALEQGNAPAPALIELGGNLQIDQTFGFTGPRQAVRVLALDPAIAQTDIEGALSKFDTRWTTSMSWQTIDQPVGTALETFQAFGIPTIQRQLANFSSTLAKPLPTGGVAGITFETNYEFSNLNQRVNPAYRPSVLFGFEQPLLQGFGTEINQLRAGHPGSTLFPLTGSGRGEGILLTRLTFDQQRTQFEFTVASMLLNIEIAYWDLYTAYTSLYSIDEALRQAYGTWRINKVLFDAGKIPIQQLAPIRAQYERFRGQRLQQLGDLLNRERILRGLLNLPVEDGTRLVPIDTPTIAPYEPDWYTALNESMTLFPDLILARQNLKRAQLELINVKNLLLPDLRLTATYDFNALGNRLDGPTVNNAFRNLSNGDFSSWSIGLRGEIPIGFRDAHAQVRAARLRLAQASIELNNHEMRVQRFLLRVYQNLIEFQERIKTSRAEREAFAEELQARYAEFQAGRSTINFLLEAQRNWANALAQEYQNIAEYNKQLANWQFAKGTLLQYNNVVISEGPLPKCAQVRAVEHFQERAKALICRERAQPPDNSCGCDADCCSPVPPPLSPEPPPVPMMLKTPPAPELEPLPAVQRVGGIEKKTPPTAEMVLPAPSTITPVSGSGPTGTGSPTVTGSLLGTPAPTGTSPDPNRRVIDTQPVQFDEFIEMMQKQQKKR